MTTHQNERLSKSTSEDAQCKPISERFHPINERLTDVNHRAITQPSPN
jgi:hypothetical protein